MPLRRLRRHLPVNGEELFVPLHLPLRRLRRHLPINRAEPVLAVDDRDRHLHPVLRGRPQALRGVVVAVVSASHRLLFDDRALARLHVVVDRLPGRRERGVEEAHHLAVEFGVGTREGGVGGVGLRDDMQAAGVAVENLQPLQAV